MSTVETISSRYQAVFSRTSAALTLHVRLPAGPSLSDSSCAPMHVQDIMEPFHYINQVPGKDVRGKLIDAFQASNQYHVFNTRAAAMSGEA